jgi:CheY-like chemotaxis protein
VAGSNYSVRAKDDVMLISVVDDDDHFCEALRRWADGIRKKMNKDIELNIHKTGKQFFKFLRKLDGPTSKRTIILLDLDFDGRKTAGLRALARIRTSRRKSIRRIPVVIYSNSDDPSEIDSCYLKFANSYVWKGNGDEQKQRFLELVNYWADTASLPPN